MDHFSPDYVQHNLPLLIVSGLSAESSVQGSVAGTEDDFLHAGGFRIRVDAPVVSGHVADELLASFRQQDASEATGSLRNSRAFNIATAGRVGQLALISIAL
jgi:trafficking protein particle complex subunit 11